MIIVCVFVVFFFKQKTAYEMRISDWSSDVCSSDLLAVVQRLGDSGGEVEPRHLLVTDLGVQAHEFGPLERAAERDGVAERGQQDVAARLVRLRLDREADVVALVGDEIGRASCRERVCQYV